MRTRVRRLSPATTAVLLGAPVEGASGSDTAFGSSASTEGWYAVVRSLDPGDRKSPVGPVGSSGVSRSPYPTSAAATPALSRTAGVPAPCKLSMGIALRHSAFRSAGTVKMICALHRGQVGLYRPARGGALGVMQNWHAGQRKATVRCPGEGGGIVTRGSASVRRDANLGK